MSDKLEIKIKWRIENEKILKSWCDKSICYQIMHDRAHKRYWCLNAWFAIPVIIISTITGTGNMSQGSLEKKTRDSLVIAIGSLNLLAAIMTTISQFLLVAQKSEGHRLASVLWDKFARKVKIELSKIRDDRVDCDAFMLQCQQEYDRLVETSPIIPSDIIRWFRNKVENDEIIDLTGCQLCIYDNFCFPFGFECCNRPSCDNKCCGSSTVPNSFFSGVGELELPEIIGRIKPTTININNSKDDENEYRIYSSNKV